MLAINGDSTDSIPWQKYKSLKVHDICHTMLGMSIVLPQMQVQSIGLPYCGQRTSTMPLDCTLQYIE